MDRSEKFSDERFQLEDSALETGIPDEHFDCTLHYGVCTELRISTVSVFSSSGRDCGIFPLLEV